MPVAVEALELLAEVEVGLELREFPDGVGECGHAADGVLDELVGVGLLGLQTFMVFLVDFAELLVEGGKAQARAAVEAELVADKSYPF